MEASGEIAGGRVAVACVILNRTKLLYASEGTIESTATWPSHVSWCEFAYVGGRYQRVCSGPAQICSRSPSLLAKTDPRLLFACRGVPDLMCTGKYRSPAKPTLTDDTVLTSAWRSPALRGS